MKGFAVAADATVACPRKGCAAAVGQPCRPTPKEADGWREGWVHFGRRLRRLLEERRRQAGVT